MACNTAYVSQSQSLLTRIAVRALCERILLVIQFMQFCRFVSSLLVAVLCNSPPIVFDGEQYSVQSQGVAADLFARGTVVSYRCMAGRRFEDGTSDKTIECTGIGLWNETPLTCDCE